MALPGIREPTYGRYTQGNPDLSLRTKCSGLPGRAMLRSHPVDLLTIDLGGMGIETEGGGGGLGEGTELGLGVSQGEETPPLDMIENPGADGGAENARDVFARPAAPLADGQWRSAPSSAR